jgi:molybdenum cofactor biosynthesis enzyme MoaA
MLLRIRLDKTARSGTNVARRYCNLNCIWCHSDYFDHYGFTAISNNHFIEAVRRLIRVAKPTETHVRIAGAGEPMTVGSELVDLICRLKKMPAVSKVKLTTNGVLLEAAVQQLIDVHLDSVTISLNSLQQDSYVKYSRHNVIHKVLKGIERAYMLGLPMKINVIYWRNNSNQINEYEKLAITYKGLRIKFFDLIPSTSEDQLLYLPLADLENDLLHMGATFIEETSPYPQRIYTLPSGVKFDVKISGKLNTCPNVGCAVRDFCLEGCRHSVRIGLDGIMKPCGIRNDNSVELTAPGVSDSYIWQSLHSGGKVGYEN